MFAEAVHQSSTNVSGKTSHNFVLLQLQSHVTGGQPAGVSHFGVCPEAQQSLYDGDRGSAPEDGFVKSSVARGLSLGIQESSILGEKSDAVDTDV